MDPTLDELVTDAARLVESADSIVVAAGAGMGVDSGLPDFRGDKGFWTAYPALGKRGICFSDAASAVGFKQDPILSWGFYGHRLALYRRTRPHAGFHLLHDWMMDKPDGGFVFTSNVDGQFQRAGFAEAIVEEVHGSIHWLQCTKPCSDAVWPADDLELEVDEEACAWVGPLPSCPWCGALARPNILMFNDADWVDARKQQQRSRFETWFEGKRRIVVVEIGAGTAIATVRAFSHRMLMAGCGLVRINVREHQVPGQFPGPAVGLPLGALEALRGMAGGGSSKGGDCSPSDVGRAGP